MEESAVKFSDLINLQPLFEFSIWSVGFWVLAVVVSGYWVCDAARWTQKQIDDGKEYDEYEFSHGLSDFLVSFGGWGALYLLLANLITGAHDTFNAFLGTIAILGISGYGYKIAGKLTEEKPEKGKKK